MEIIIHTKVGAALTIMPSTKAADAMFRNEAVGTRAATQQFDCSKEDSDKYRVR
jgi:hypothetical protein